MERQIDVPDGLIERGKSESCSSFLSRTPIYTRGNNSSFKTKANLCTKGGYGGKFEKSQLLLFYFESKMNLVNKNKSFYFLFFIMEHKCSKSIDY